MVVTTARAMMKAARETVAGATRTTVTVGDDGNGGKSGDVDAKWRQT